MKAALEAAMESWMWGLEAKKEAAERSVKESVVRRRSRRSIGIVKRSEHSSGGEAVINLACLHAFLTASQPASQPAIHPSI